MDERQQHPPSFAGYCFVCHGERVHDTAPATAAPDVTTCGAPELRQRQQVPRPPESRSIEARERIARIAAGGIPLGDRRAHTDVTKTRRDGARGRLLYDYGATTRDPLARSPGCGGSSTGPRRPGALYGRALVVIAIE
jgi:hypothetical protein